jgi:hypothetical protein
MALFTQLSRVDQRIADLPWPELLEQLDRDGFAQTPTVYTPEECRQLSALFDDDGRFRSTIEMRRHRFGEGRYRYFGAPLPELVDHARHALYPPLAGLANTWAECLGDGDRFPAGLGEFLDRCHDAGQHRTTPLLLRYGAGGHNTLHQDLYGEVAFPLQAVTVLDRPGVDFDGGQFVLLEQRPRAQSRAHVIDLRQGAFLLFPTRHRPVRGTRGFYRSAMRHGVATVHEGERTTLGVIFHDAA